MALEGHVSGSAKAAAVCVCVCVCNCGTGEVEEAHLSGKGLSLCGVCCAVRQHETSRHIDARLSHGSRNPVEADVIREQPHWLGTVHKAGKIVSLLRPSWALARSEIKYWDVVVMTLCRTSQAGTRV